ARGKQRAAELEALRPQLDEATRTAQQAGEAATVAKTELSQARQSQRELTQLDGAKVCRHCGQALTDGHVKEEKKRRGADAARARWRQAEQVQQQWNKVKAQESASLQTWQRLKADLPADPQSVRKDHRALEAEEQSLQKNLEINRALARETEREIERIA